MSDKNQYQAFLRAKITGAIVDARAASNLTHNGVKGSVLEILISKLFRPLLPSDIGVGTGQIIEQHSGRMSTQMDIILYDKSIVPPIFFDETTGIFPIEAVLYTIEVKTKLNATELSVAHDSAKLLTEFKYLPGLKNADGSDRHHSIEKVRSVIFALNTDLSGNKLTEAERYEKIYKNKNDIAHIRAICVASREYCYDNGEHWITFESQDIFDEILGFIGGVTNTYKSVASSRYNPLLGYYIVPEIKTKIGPITREIKRVEIVCESCKKSLQLKPEIGTQNITVNGSINHSEPCPDCGGKMQSKSGVYVFENGELVEEKV
jgi:hypothetical protein